LNGPYTTETTQVTFFTSFQTPDCMLTGQIQDLSISGAPLGSTSVHGDLHDGGSEFGDFTLCGGNGASSLHLESSISWDRIGQTATSAG